MLRSVWTSAFLAYVAHVLLAFHYFHHWSHTAAYEHVVRASGVGAGLYLNYTFTIVWGADVAISWCGMERYAARRAWIKCLTHAFMGFIIFNGAVVFASSPTRWINLVVFGLIGMYGVASLIPRLHRRTTNSHRVVP